MVEMTPRQRVLAALNRQEPDRTPFELFLGLTPSLLETFVVQTGHVDPDEYWNAPVRSVAHRPLPDFEMWRLYGRYYPETLPPGTRITPFGVALAYGSTEHFVRQLHPLAAATTVVELVDYPLPDPANPARWVHLASQVESLHGRDLAAQGELYVTIFETAWSLRGFEELLTDLALRPDLVEVLFDRLTEYRIRQAVQLAQAGVDVLRLGDDVATQTGMLISPAAWRSLAQAADGAYHCGRPRRQTGPAHFLPFGRRLPGDHPRIDRDWRYGAQSGAARVHGSGPTQDGFWRPAGVLGYNWHPDDDAFWHAG